VTVEFLNQIAKQTIETTLIVAGPILLVSMVVGLFISLFQAITQVQEFTLTFVPKILAVFLSIFILLPWMTRIMVEFTTEIIRYIPEVGR